MKKLKISLFDDISLFLSNSTDINDYSRNSGTRKWISNKRLNDNDFDKNKIKMPSKISEKTKTKPLEDDVIDLNKNKKLNFNELSINEQYSYYNKQSKFKKIKLLKELSKEQKKEFKKYKNEKEQEKEQKKKDFNKLNLFEIRDFNFWYKGGKKQALFDINLDIEKSKVTSLIGPSGCGKSTFIKCLNRMNELETDIVYSGNIWYDGTNINAKSIKEVELRSMIGMVFQKPTPFEMSIYDNVAFGPKAHGITNKKVLDKIVEESLKNAALWDEVKNELHTSLGTGLSGGQQQRLCIARAIALKPKVLLMDEPTSALDPIATAKIEELILKLSESISIIIVTHSMAQAQRISDNTVFFYQGKIVESGKTKQIFTKPQNKQTKDYVNGKIG